MNSLKNLLFSPPLFQRSAVAALLLTVLLVSSACDFALPDSVCSSSGCVAATPTPTPIPLTSGHYQWNARIQDTNGKEKDQTWCLAYANDSTLSQALGDTSTKEVSVNNHIFQFSNAGSQSDGYLDMHTSESLNSFTNGAKIGTC